AGPAQGRRGAGDARDPACAARVGLMDRRLTPATDRVALRGARVARDVITDGERRRVAMPLVDLCRAPDGPRDRQLLFGADVLLIEARDGWGFVQAAADGYCGWV